MKNSEAQMAAAVSYLIAFIFSIKAKGGFYVWEDSLDQFPKNPLNAGFKWNPA